MFLLALAAALVLPACGGDDDPDGDRAPRQPPLPQEVTCGDLRSPADYRRLAERLVDRVVAPEDQARADTRGLIADSLRGTCGQPRLPGVSDPDDYRPVEPVLDAIQQSFDEHEIFE